MDIDTDLTPGITPGSPPWRELGWTEDGGTVYAAPIDTEPPALDDHPRTTLPAVAGMWHEAVDRGWTITVDPGSGSWRVTSADRSAGVAYTAPEDLGGAGCVEAHDPNRTMTLTGVRDQAEAAALVRAFLGWQPGWRPAQPGGPVDCVPAAIGAGR